MQTQQLDLSSFLEDVYSRLQPDQVFDGVFAHNWQKSGSKWRGKCPWHDSKSGTAFYLDTKSLTWRCPSCDRGGGPLQYLHQIHGGQGSPKGKEFLELAKMLGGIVGLELPERELTDEQRERIQKVETRRAMLETVVSFCHRLLLTESTQAIAYLTKERGFTELDIKNLKLGVFPAAKRVADLLAGQFNLDDAIECGLLYEREPNVFRSQLEGYIIVPWNDEHGRPLTLYGRWHSKTAPEGMPKTTALKNPGKKDDKTWLRSKRSPLYLDRALAANHRDIVVVEGVFDAAILQVRGDSRVVAWVAAEPSEDQLETLVKSKIESVTLCLDPDGAGEKGTRSGVKKLTRVGIKAFVSPVLPDQQDPDEFAIANGLDAWKAHIDQRVHGFRYEARLLVEEQKPLTDAGIQKAIEKAESFVAEVPKSLQPSLQTFFWDELNTLAGIKSAKAKEAELSADGLRQVIDELKSVSDPFEQAILENEIGDTFKVRGSRLKALVDYVPNNEPVYSLPMGDLMVGLWAKIQERSLSPGPTGVLSGFYDLDALTGGWQLKDLIIVAGRPSMGKTAMLVGCAVNAAKKGHRVLIISIESSADQIGYRILSSELSINGSKFTTGTMAPDDYEKMAEKAGVISDLPIIVCDSAISRLQQIMDRCLEHNSDGKLDLILIDYLQLIEADGDNRNYELSKITRSLKLFAKEINAAIVCLSQLSRGVESRSDKRPMMSDLRDSGGIEQDADVIAMLYRDEYYDSNSPNRGVAEVIVAKNRNGPVGTVELSFEPQYTRFRNMTSKPWRAA